MRMHPWSWATFATLWALHASAGCGGGAAEERAAQSPAPAPVASQATEPTAPTTRAERCRTDGALIDRAAIVDESGRIVEVQLSTENGEDQTLHLTYDEHGRVVTQEVTPGDPEDGPETLVHVYEVDLANRRQTIEARQGDYVSRKVTWEYDEAGRPIRLHALIYGPPIAEGESEDGHEIDAEPFTMTETCEYDEAGRPARHTRNDKRFEFAYESDSGWPTSMTDLAPYRGEGPEIVSTFTVEGGAVVQLDIGQHGEGDRTIRWIGDCLEYFFPPVCSRASAPPLPPAP